MKVHSIRRRRRISMYKEKIDVDINSLPYEKAYELFYLVPEGSQFEKELLERMDYLTKHTPKTDESIKIILAATFRNTKNDH